MRSRPSAQRERALFAASWPLLPWPVELGFIGRVALHDHEAEHSAPRVIGHGTSEPVKPWLTQVNARGRALMPRNRDRDALTIVRKERHVRSVILVLELEFQITAAFHDDDRGIPHQLTFRNANP